MIVTLQALYHDEASRQQQNANKFTVLLTLAHLQNVKNIPKLFANQIIAVAAMPGFISVMNVFLANKIAFLLSIFTKERKQTNKE